MQCTYRWVEQIECDARMNIGHTVIDQLCSICTYHHEWALRVKRRQGSSINEWNGQEMHINDTITHLCCAVVTKEETVRYNRVWALIRYRRAEDSRCAAGGKTECLMGACEQVEKERCDREQGIGIHGRCWCMERKCVRLIAKLKSKILSYI